MNKLLGQGVPNHVVYLSGKSTKDIDRQLKRIHLQYDVLAAYGLNGYHYLVISTDADKIKFKTGEDK